MAGTMRCFTKINMSLLTTNVTRQFIVNNTRSLYSEASLGMVDYRNARETFRKKYVSAIDGFRTKMQRTTSDNSEIVFSEDLKALLHLIEKVPNDLELLQSLLQKYNNQNSEMRFGDFKFGPVVMRALYYLNEPDVAKELFLNPDFNQFFHQHTTYMILLDLLYENEKYQDIIEINDRVKTICVNGLDQSKLALNVVVMACLKLDTPESLQYGLKIYKELNDQNNPPLRRFISTLSALALKQNHPKIALELVKSCTNPNYILIMSIKIMALVELDKFHDVTRFLQDVLNSPIHSFQICADTIEKVEAALDKQSPEKVSQVQLLLTALNNANRVSKMTLYEHLSLPIHSEKRLRSNIYANREWMRRSAESFEQRSQFSDYKHKSDSMYERNQYNSG